MGLCGSAPVKQTDTSKNIDQAISKARIKLDNEVKLLLLGAGESGKSTFAKQIKIIHLKGFSLEERSSYKPIIFNNAISSMRCLIAAARDFNLELNDASKRATTSVTAGSEDCFAGELTPELANDIKILWSDTAIRETFSRSAEIQLLDSAPYFFEKIDELSAPGYVPEEKDIVRSRSKTTGIVEIEFDLENVHFKMVDVGGQRSERKKWMHCFQDVTAVLFCVALSEYDLKLYEDDTTNRMHESLKLFKEICNNKWFIDTAMILFLNKRDIFENKIKRVDLRICFPSYTGGCNYQPAIDFIRDQFISQNENPRKSVFPHVTCATDTSNITHVFRSVQEVVLKKALESDLTI
eukprot:TRINITY_DN82_c1_g2_i1.p1 TRINITY_DN82_c1_g2~~TRINITY_DN82_c1_g2_i1.p1  ORF type:complete len:352 (-),score=139.41 TRINITY_DN82_c1_g2_i1:72-1127(-)